MVSGKPMKPIFALLIALSAAYFGWDQLAAEGIGTTKASQQSKASHAVADDGESAIAQAYQRQVSGKQLSGAGTVIKVLPDDNKGSRHQRFILGISSNLSVLVAHNIDLAPRVADIRKGDRVEFHGVYEWNDRGGVIHWTHRDPAGRHEAGWLRHEGRTVQ